MLTKIPYPGDPEKTPSGPMQFQNDSTGLFLRREHAKTLYECLRVVEDRLAKDWDERVTTAWVSLRLIADQIEKDVLQIHGKGE